MNNKTDCYRDIIEVCQYQSIFLDRLGMMFIQLEKDTLFSTEEMEKTRKTIEGILQDMFQNAGCIDRAIENIHNIDLEFEEKLGYPSVSRLLEKVK